LFDFWRFDFSGIIEFSWVDFSELDFSLLESSASDFSS